MTDTVIEESEVSGDEAAVAEALVKVAGTGQAGGPRPKDNEHCAQEPHRVLEHGLILRSNQHSSPSLRRGRLRKSSPPYLDAEKAGGSAKECTLSGAGAVREPATDCLHGPAATGLIAPAPRETRGTF